MAPPQKTDYNTVAIEETGQEEAASYTNEGRWLVGSEVITVVAARAWEFSVPLALLGPPGPHASLRAPAALALATTLATATLAPPTGAWADRSDRRRASRVARLAQILGTALGVLGVASLVYGSEDYVALGLVLLGGAVESVAAVVSKNAPKKDWAPALFDGDDLVDELSHTTSALATAGQVAEVVGPLLGALCVSCLGPRRGACAAGVLNIASSAPAQVVLDSLYAKCSKLRTPRAVREVVEDEKVNAWKRWAAQPSGTSLITLAFCCLWFTALAPHGAVLTAFLATQHADPELIAVFRICGAFFGFVGIAVFSRCSRVSTSDESVSGARSARRVSSLRMASLGALLFQLTCAGLAVYALRDGDMVLVFCAAVACSRAGLYAFDVGYVELQQLLVDERDRGACQGVEAALCGAMELGLALTTLVFFSEPSSFVELAELSTAFVMLALVLFAAWLGLYRIFDHIHAERDHGHAHTAQDLKRLAGDGRHVHVAYAGVKACSRSSNAHAHPHPHPHPVP